ncbi:MAG TPA: MFS transporter, partial [Pseudonocardiaceae bacterium]
MGGTRPAIVFRHRGAFLVGIAAVSVGVVLHLPMYLSSREMGYHMAGMPIDTAMKIGMALIVAGFATTAYGLVPRRAVVGTKDAVKEAAFEVRALDDVPIRAAHVALLAVMAAAVTIDVMKPTTLAFVMPGIATEYGLRSPANQDGLPVGLLPLCALTGMVLGSLLWGWLGDRIGRRASVLLAGVMFIGTAICGAMPSFALNLLMCFLMGAAVGGMLPIAFALLAETIPARHRGWLMVLIGGDVAGAYVLTSYLSSRLQPVFGWRVMWLIGLPTGIARGARRAARAVLRGAADRSRAGQPVRRRRRLPGGDPRIRPRPRPDRPVRRLGRPDRAERRRPRRRGPLPASGRPALPRWRARRHPPRDGE